MRAAPGGEAVGLIELRRPGEDARTTAGQVLRVILREPIIVASELWRYVRYQRARSRMRMQRPPDALWIGELDVHPDFRNCGIGGAMLRQAEERARRESFPRLALTTTTINPAQHLYSRHGFRIVDQRLDAAYERLTGIPGRVLMVAELT